MTNAKKTVGILSMQRVPNYGSFLQAYGLKRLLLECGAGEVYFIDIEQGRVLPGYAVRRSPLQKIRHIAGALLDGSFLFRLRSRRFYAEMLSRITSSFPLLGLDEPCPEHYDLAVIGSDEVFNCCQACAWGYTPQLFGRIPRADRVISYAASFGHTTMKDIEHYGVKHEMAEALRSMHALSVRDVNSYEIVTELTGKTPFRHVDPVLMFDYSPYVKPVNEKDYIIVYTYPNRIKNKDEIAAIRAFANKHHKKLISIGFYFPWCDKTVIPDPFEVLGYFKQADYIITDTFHGSVMSLKFNRPFAAMVRPSNRQKMTSLLSQFHLEERIVDNMGQLEEKLLSCSDYEVVNAELQKERNRSLDYLNNNL